MQINSSEQQDLTGMEAEARVERHLISALLETSETLIVVLDHRGRIVRFNHACEKLTGQTAAQVQGKYFWDLLQTSAEIEPVKTAFRTLDTDYFPSHYENY